MWPRSLPKLLVAALTIFSISLIYSAFALFSIRSPPISLQDKVQRFQIETGEDEGLLEDHPKNLYKNLTLEKIVKPTRFIEISPGNFAFAAITDARDGNMGKPQVRVLMSITRPSDFACEYSDGSFVPGKLYEFSENHKKLEQVYFLNCPLPNGIELDSIEEILIVHKSQGKSAMVPISYRIPDEHAVHPIQSFAICVPFVFGTKYSAKHLIEFIEFNKLIGVDQISIYTDSSLNPEVKKVMDKYSENGLLEVIPFSLPFNAESIWYHGQLLTITDCLFRHTGRSDFVAFHDLDEFLIPRVGDDKEKTPPNRIPLLKELFRDPKLGSLRVKTQYFAPSDPDPPMILKNVNRMSFVDDRFTKCVLRPHYVFEQGIHHTSRVIQDDYKSDPADEKHLILYHFKDKGPTPIEDRYVLTHFGPEFSKIFAQKVLEFGF